MLRAYSELKSLPIFGKLSEIFISQLQLTLVLDKRLKFLTLLMLIVTIITFVITSLNFGVGILEDNFVSKLSTHYNSSVEFMSFYGLLNIYMYTMTYVYSPGNKAIHGKKIWIVFL